MDQEKLRKRMSQIELEIDEMNQVIDENLQLSEPHEQYEDQSYADVDTHKAVDPEFRKYESEQLVDEQEVKVENKNINNASQLEIEKSQLEEEELPVEEQELEPTPNEKEVLAEQTPSTDKFETPAEEPASLEERASEETCDPKTRPLYQEPAPSAPSSVSTTPKAPTPPSPAVTLPKVRGGPAASSAAKRSTSNPSPFRVVSVTSKQPDESSPAQKLQTRHDYLARKCTKLSREIQYLCDLRDRGAVAPEDARKINNALTKLQEYLDLKTKERYEIGVLLSRQLRREIDRGENGQFWVGH